MKEHSPQSSDNAAIVEHEHTGKLNGAIIDNPVVQRALRRLKESQATDNHVSHYTKHSSHAVKHSSTW